MVSSMGMELLQADGTMPPAWLQTDCTMAQVWMTASEVAMPQADGAMPPQCGCRPMVRDALSLDDSFGIVKGGNGMSQAPYC